MSLTDDEKEELLKELLLEKLYRSLRAAADLYLAHVRTKGEGALDELLAASGAAAASDFDEDFLSAYLRPVVVFGFSSFLARCLFKEDNDFAEYCRIIRMGLQTSDVPPELREFFLDMLPAQEDDLEEKES